MKSAYEALMGYASIRQKWLRIFTSEGGKNYGYGKLATDGMGATEVSAETSTGIWPIIFKASIYVLYSESFCIANFVQSVRINQKMQQKQSKCLLGKRDLGITSLLIHMKNLSPLSKSDVVFNTKNKTTVKISQKVSELISSP